MSGTATFLVTAGEADGGFDFKVRDVKDNPKCEEEEEEGDDSPVPPPPCDYCDPTSFWYDSVEDWLRTLVEGR